MKRKHQPNWANKLSWGVLLYDMASTWDFLDYGMMDDVLMDELAHSNYAEDPHCHCYLISVIYIVLHCTCCCTTYAHCHSVSCDLVFSASQPIAHVHWPRASSHICHLDDWNVFKMLQAASIVHIPSYSLVFSCFLTGSWCWAPNQDICISAFLYDDRHSLDFAEFTKTGPSNMPKLDLQNSTKHGKPRNAGKWWRSASQGNCDAELTERSSNKSQGPMFYSELLFESHWMDLNGAVRK